MSALFFDLDGTTKEQLARATTFSSTFLDSRMRDDDKVAILVRTNRRVKVLQDFTGNADRLKDILQHLESNPSLDADGVIALEQAAQLFAPIHERVGLVYFVSGPKNLSAVSAPSNVAIYVVNVK